jgi:hypothetical protein
MLKIVFEIISMILKSQGAPKLPEQAKPSPAPETPKKQARVYITLEDWITSSGRYPDRAKSPELTGEIKKEAQKTVDHVNALLNELDWQEKVSISSGFRPSGANAAAGGAKRSAHMTGLALDIMQPKPTNKLGLAIRAAQANKGSEGILGRHELMMEALEATVGVHSLWLHLDRVKRSPRPSMEFKP